MLFICIFLFLPAGSLLGAPAENQLQSHASFPKTLPHINIWSGRQQTLSLTARNNWKLESEHGRLLTCANEPGPVTFTLPELKGVETVFLSIDGLPAACLECHPQNLLEGLSGQLECHRKDLQKLGMKHLETGASALMTTPSSGDASVFGRFEILAPSVKVVLFTDKWDFPMKMPPKPGAVTLGGIKKNAPLSVIFNDKESIIDNTGGGISWVIADFGHKYIILPPDFNLNDIDNVLFLKKELSK